MSDIPPPSGDLSSTPDKYTAISPDFTGDHAHNRVLYIGTRWFRYGTDDKGHAAALVLSALLLIAALFSSLIGLAGLFSGSDAGWVDNLIGWIGNAFLFTAGIAVGKGSDSKGNGG